MKANLRFHGCRLSEVKWNEYTILYLENSRIRVGILPEKGAEIFEFRFKPIDLDVLWHRAKPWPDPIHYRPESLVDGDSFWDQYIGGWQESFPSGNTCGDLRGARMGLHGEVTFLPWNVTVTADTPSYVEIELHVICRRMPFQMTRRMSIRKDETFVRFDEEIENLGGETLEYVWGHHPAFGPPFLSEHCVLDLPPGTYRTLPLTNGRVLRFEPDQMRNAPVLRGKNGRDINLSHVPPPDNHTSDNWETRLLGKVGRVAIRNPKHGIGFGMVWDAKVFPHLWEWENAAGIHGYPFWMREYLLALEPFNCPIGGLNTFAGKKILPELRANERKQTTLFAGFCPGLQRFNGKFLS